ncbi:MAG: DNA-binding LytR/AlgR family response regulator [Flavobacteriales bacterium]|jgi:DNA-binding LytR/AlgR family response regulator
MNCLIVDDEIMARTSLENFCSREPGLNLISTCENAKDALVVVQENEIDLLFLDIEMPGMSGLELLELLPYMPQVVFTTINTEYAFEAYEYDITDFLKKPITQIRFEKAIAKATEQWGQLTAISKASAIEEIYVRADKKLVRIPFSEILYFENVGDYVKVHSTFGPFMFHYTIKILEANISNPRFLKIHRAYIINMSHINDIQDNTLTIGEAVIPISRAHKTILMKTINLL